MRSISLISAIAFLITLLMAGPSPAGSDPELKALKKELKAQGPAAIMRDDFPFKSGNGNSLVSPTRYHNSVKLLGEGETAFEERFRLISEARESILIQTYIFTGDFIGKKTAELLKERYRDGLDVRLVVDAYTKFVYGTRMMYRDMEYSGVKVGGYEPVIFVGWSGKEMLSVDEINMRFHEKYMIVDDAFAIVGGMNIADEYARWGTDPGDKWRDQDVLLSGPVVADIRDAFEKNFEFFMQRRKAREELLKPVWYRAWWRKVLEVFKPRDKADADRPGPKVEGWQDDDAAVRFMRSRPREDETYIFQTYRFLIKSAKQKIIIENAYFVPQKRIQRDLIRAAERGVDVTIITNSEATNDVYQMQPIVRHCYLPLIQAGVKIYEWQGETQGKGSLHSKFAIFDDQISVIGSYNIDPRGEKLNSEDAVVIQSYKVAAALEDYIDERDMPISKRIGLGQAQLWRDPSGLQGKFKLMFGKTFEEWY